MEMKHVLNGLKKDILLTNKMSSLSREYSVLFSIKIIDHLCEIQQYDRLISNRLFKYEQFDDVYEKQMKILTENEEYEKCNLLIKLFKQS